MKQQMATGGKWKLSVHIAGAEGGSRRKEAGGKQQKEVGRKRNESSEVE